MLKPEDIVECCMTCKYVEYSSCSTDSAYCSGQKDAPHIACPDHYVCGHYKNMLYKTDSREEKEPTDENKMGVNPLKDVKITKKVFDRDFWIPGDIYVMEDTKDNLRFMCVLIKFELGDTGIRVWVNDQGYVVFWSEQIGETFRVTKHITRDSILEYRDRWGGSGNIK